MRIAALITGILGGLWSLLLGMKWQGDANRHADLVAAAQSAGADLGEVGSLMTASWFLVAGALVGIVGGVLALRGRGKLGGGLMLAIALLPAMFTMKALAGTFLLVVAGVLALLAKPKRVSN